DLLFSQPYQTLIQKVTSGQFVGQSTINGVTVNQLTFQSKDADWQVWIKDGPQPLPGRFVLNTKTLKGQPECTALLTKLEHQTHPAATAIRCQPPAGARKVEQLPVTCGANKQATREK